MTTAEKVESGLVLLMSDRLGNYMPQQFAKSFDSKVWPIDQEELDILLAGPDHEHYLEAWEAVLNMTCAMIDGRVWKLHQEGDLWAMCEDLMTEEEKLNWGIY